MSLKISVYIATSLDGYIARPDGNLDWQLNADTSANEPGEDHGYADFMREVDTLVMGRHTFEKVLTFRTYPRIRRPCAGVGWGAGVGAKLRRGARHHKRLVTPACAPSGPGPKGCDDKARLRRCNPCPGFTLGGGLRLASIALSSQRRAVLFADRFLTIGLMPASASSC